MNIYLIYVYTLFAQFWQESYKLYLNIVYVQHNLKKVIGGHAQKRFLDPFLHSTYDNITKIKGGTVLGDVSIFFRSKTKINHWFCLLICLPRIPSSLFSKVPNYEWSLFLAVIWLFSLLLYVEWSPEVSAYIFVNPTFIVPR